MDRTHQNRIQDTCFEATISVAGWAVHFYRIMARHWSIFFIDFFVEMSVSWAILLELGGLCIATCLALEPWPAILNVDFRDHVLTHFNFKRSNLIVIYTLSLGDFWPLTLVTLIANLVDLLHPLLQFKVSVPQNGDGSEIATQCRDTLLNFYTQPFWLLGSALAPSPEGAPTTHRTFTPSGKCRSRSSKFPGLRMNTD